MVLYWEPRVGCVILPVAIRRMKKEIQYEVHRTRIPADMKGMKNIRMLFIIITEAVFSTAMAIARFFQRQHNAMKKATPRP